MDSSFISLPLLDKLAELGIDEFGTIRENKQQDAPLIKIYLQSSPGDLLILHLMVEICFLRGVATKYLSLTQIIFHVNQFHPSNDGQRLIKEYVQVPIPNPFKHYDGLILGADLFDQFITNSLVKIKSKKWWWPFFACLLNVSVVNSWRLYSSVYRNDMPLRKFIRELVLEKFGTFGNI